MAISSALGSSALLPAGLGFRNVIINGDFSINQRGFTSTTTNASYGFDRWIVSSNDGTTTYSAQTFTVGNPISGQEPTNFARLVTTGQTLAGAYSFLTQRIESVRTFSGQQVTVSFWAKASSGTPKVSIELEQVFGTGGSPSSAVQTYAGQVTLSTSWVRYSLTATIPSISGKTIGTAGDDNLRLSLWVSGGSTFNARTGSLGIQSNTFDFWGVQLEQNSQPTPFEQRPIGVELALCQRYYQRMAGLINSNIGFGYWFGSVAYCSVPISVPLRTIVSSVNLGYNSVGIDRPGTSAAAVTSVGFRGQTSTLLSIDFTTGSSLTNGAFTHALLTSSSGAYFEVSAEL